MGVGTYIVVRVILTIPMIFLLLTATFIVFYIVPSDPVALMVGEGASEESIEVLRVRLGLDKPLHIQYLDYISRIVYGDFGRSLKTGRSVIGEILSRFPTTLELTTISMAIGTFLGVVSGVVSAKRRDSVFDHLVRSGNLLVYSMPIFWIGTMLQALFGIILGVLPVSGTVSYYLRPARITGLLTLDSVLTLNFPALLSSIVHLILPAFTLSLYVWTSITRVSRGEMVKVLSEDYIYAARARGLREKTILFRHGLRNALLPIITMAGLQFAILLGGAVLVESVFSLPGIGRLIVDAMISRDFPVIRGGIVWYALLISVVSALVDVIMSVVDPRIKY